MALESRIQELTARHRSLDAIIASEMKHPAVDDLRIAEMKKEKLRIRDEIAQLEGAM